MSIKGLSWDQIVQKINNKWDGDIIPIDFLRKMCIKGKLNDRAVEHILEWQFSRHPNSVKSELSKSLIRNRHLSMEARMLTLRFFFFKIGPMKKSESRKRILAQEVIEICKDQPPKYRLEILNLIEEIKLKGMTSPKATNSQAKKQNIVSLEPNVLMGISTRDYKEQNAEKKDSRENDKYIGSEKEVSLTDLKDFFRRDITKGKSLSTTIQSRLNEPWGADIDSLQWILRNFGPFDTESFILKPDVVKKFIIEYFKCHTFGNRITAKPLLKSNENWLDFSTWRKNYGASFLLSKRNFVPREFLSIFDTFGQFIINLNPGDLFIRKSYGLSYRIGEKEIYSFLYYLKTPDLDKRSSGKFLIVFFYIGKMPTKLKDFLGLQQLREYLNTYSKDIKTSKLNIQNCYVKECKKIDDVIEALALFQLEVPFQFLDNSYSTLHKVEEFFPPFELRKRKAFLEFLGSKKRVIARIRERKSDIHCINCNQPLTDKLSRVRGYGPDCWRKLKHLNITHLDISSSSDPFERYATQDFGDWIESVQVIAQELTNKKR